MTGWFLQRRTAGGTAGCLAMLPALTIPAHSYYLIGTPTYANAVTADANILATSLMGSNESVVLLKGAATCGSSPTLLTRVDSVSYGAITDTNVALMLPAYTNATPFAALRRKACYDSTADATGTGVLVVGPVSGGQATAGSGEEFGSNDADLLGLAAPRPAQRWERRPSWVFAPSSNNPALE